MNHYQFYSAFLRCRKVYGLKEIHVQLLAKQMNVLASDIVEYVDNHPTLISTKILTNFNDSEYSGMVIVEVSAIPFISSITVKREGDVNPAIVVSVTGDTFKNLTSAGNWTFDFGTTGLTLTSISADTATKTITLSGTAKPGIVSIQAKAAAMEGGIASDVLYFEMLPVSFDYATISALNARVVELEAIQPEAGSVTLAVAAAEILLIDGAKPLAEDSVSVGGVEYTFVTDLTTDPDTIANEVKIGASVELTIDNLIIAINTGASEGVVSVGTIANPLVTAAKTSATSMTATAKIKGATGNAIILDSNFTDEANLWTAGATVLKGGIPGTIAVLGKIFIATDRIYIAFTDTTVSDSTGWRSAAIS